MAIRGMAGAGKTTLLSELDRNLNHINRLYLAPTASSVAVLKAEGFAAGANFMILETIFSEDFLSRVPEKVRAQLTNLSDGTYILETTSDTWKRHR